MKFPIESNLTREDETYLRDRLDEFNEPFAGPRNAEEFGFTVRDENGTVVAGLVASCIWEWLHINVIWVSDTLRGQGYGSSLLEAAEHEGISRNRKYAMLHTFSFQARPFYERHGYQLSGELTDFPKGHSQFMMFKRLAGDA
ncbi:MAG: GNAT family N-acetyltransferase [Proteobacteria bacterium]|nr:GNAT family N-acetyltransferase [Pseudomonadota bacterium]MDA1301339.1 GNAT family N-acetyltransferase [Pseudomonadota bacterium]